MDSANETACLHLAEKIIALLARGIMADETVCAYIEATLAISSLRDLKLIFADEAHEERDSLIDLLLFPDESFQMALSPLLLEHAFSTADQQWVIRYLSKHPQTVTIYFPTFGGHIVLPLTSMTVSAMVKRLNMRWQPAPLLRQVTGSHLVPDRQMAIYVRLRNSHPPSDPAGIDLLCRFLEIFADAADFFDLFDFTVEWIARINGMDGYQQLMKEKQHYVEAVRYAIRFERMHQSHNMETLMLRGIQAPTMGVPEATGWIDMIDRLALGLYGRTDPASPAGGTVGRAI